MVDEELGRDLLSFGKKVLVLGDPAQLPPVKGGGFFTEAEPDVMLTEVHRQAADNPIIRLSMIDARGRRLDARRPTARRVVVSRDGLDPALVTGADQVLVGLNRTRRAYNNRLRELRGFSGALSAIRREARLPAQQSQEGPAQWRAVRGEERRRGAARQDAHAGDAGRGRSRQVPARRRACRSSSRAARARSLMRCARIRTSSTIGYALTVHKAQGSQWDDVALFDESFAFREHRARWLYTGVTRAAKRLTLVM